MALRFWSAFFLASMALPASAAKTAFKVLHVGDLASALKSASAPFVYDANVASTRENVGVIPGAALLSSYDKFNAEKELPSDKNVSLVFYCANTHCMASHYAAEKAIAAGHKNVSVMVDGIYGWRDAGQPCVPAPGQAKPLSAKSAQALVRANAALIVDVRESEERHEVIPGEQWIPMSRAQNHKDWDEFTRGLPKNKSVIFHCAMGMRSKRASEKLSQSGFSTGYFNGVDQWKEAGLPVEKGPAK